MASCKAQPAMGPAFTETFPVPGTGGVGLPAGFPPSVDSPLAWTGLQFSDESQFIHMLSNDDVIEAETALCSFKGKHTWRWFSNED